MVNTAPVTPFVPAAPLSGDAGPASGVEKEAKGPLPPSVLYTQSLVEVGPPSNSFERAMLDEGLAPSFCSEPCDTDYRQRRQPTPARPGSTHCCADFGHQNALTSWNALAKALLPAGISLLNLIVLCL